MNSRLKSYLKLFLKIAFTVAALWLVYTKVDLQALLVFWKKANVWWLVVAFLVFVVSQVISSFRLLNFFKNIRLNLTLGYNVRLYLLGMFYNLFLPGGIGGDGYKILKVKREHNRPAKEVFSAVFFDRLAGLWALAGLLVLMGLTLPVFREYALYATLAFFAGTAAYYWVLRRFFRDHSARFIRTHLLALGVQGCQLVAVIFILRALGVTEEYLPYMFSFLVSSLATLFPFSVGGLGAREVAIAWVAGQLGLNEALCVSISLCFYCLSAILSLSAAIFLFQPEKKTTATEPPVVTEP